MGTGWPGIATPDATVWRRFQSPDVHAHALLDRQRERVQAPFVAREDQDLNVDATEKETPEEELPEEELPGKELPGEGAAATSIEPLPRWDAVEIFPCHGGGGLYAA